GCRGSPIGQRQSWLSRSSSIFGFLDFFLFWLVMILPASMLALPFRAARNRKSGQSGHPLSRGDLWASCPAAEHSGAGSNPSTKARDGDPSGLWQRCGPPGRRAFYATLVGAGPNWDKLGPAGGHGLGSPSSSRPRCSPCLPDGRGLLPVALAFASPEEAN